MAFLVLLAVLGVIGTSMSSPVPFPTEDQLSSIFSKLGWSEEEMVRALANENVTFSSDARMTIRC